MVMMVPNILELGDKCPKCSGMGSVRKLSDSDNFEDGYWMDCPTCKGSGQVDAKTLNKINKLLKNDI